MAHNVKRYLSARLFWALVAGTMILVVAAVVFGVRHYRTHAPVDALVAQDIARLETLFTRIGSECGIHDFKHVRNYVDFLTVSSFVGPTVGSMMLNNPKNWHGPYVRENPTMQGNLYEVIRTHQGCFLVPGSDVVLTNGHVVGKDLILDEDTDIYALVKDGVLVYNGQPLAVMIHTTGIIS